MLRRLIGAGALALACLGAGAASAVTVGEGLGDVGIKHHKPGNKALDQAAVTGKVTIVNFWATWCAACKVELVEMEELLKPQLAEGDLQVAFVSLDKDPAKAVEWLQGNLKEPATFLKSLYVDPAFEAADKLTVDSFPMTLVIGQDGKIKHIQRGFKEGEGSTHEIFRVAEGLLKAKTVH